MCQSPGNNVIISHRYLSKEYVFVALPCMAHRLHMHLIKYIFIFILFLETYPINL